MADTRHRIIEATASLFQKRGYTGSGLKQISADSAAPFGSLYHFFPGGKEELAAETLRWSGQGYEELVVAVLDAAPDIVSGVHDAFTGAADTLRSSDFADACPIATVALEVASTNETLRLVTAEIFAGWLHALTARFVAAGIAESRAGELAVLFLASLEGGFLLSRAARDTVALEVLSRAVVAAVAAALDQD